MYILFITHSLKIGKKKKKKNVFISIMTSAALLDICKSSELLSLWPDNQLRKLLDSGTVIDFNSSEVVISVKEYTLPDIWILINGRIDEKKVSVEEPQHNELIQRTSCHVVNTRKTSIKQIKSYKSPSILQENSFITNGVESNIFITEVSSTLLRISHNQIVQSISTLNSQLQSKINILIKARRINNLHTCHRITYQDLSSSLLLNSVLGKDADTVLSCMQPRVFIPGEEMKPATVDKMGAVYFIKRGKAEYVAGDKVGINSKENYDYHPQDDEGALSLTLPIPQQVVGCDGVNHSLVIPLPHSLSTVAPVVTDKVHQEIVADVINVDSDDHDWKRAMETPPPTPTTTLKRNRSLQSLKNGIIDLTSSLSKTVHSFLAMEAEIPHLEMSRQRTTTQETVLNQHSNVTEIHQNVVGELSIVFGRQNTGFYRAVDICETWELTQKALQSHTKLFQKVVSTAITHRQNWLQNERRLELVSANAMSALSSYLNKNPLIAAVCSEACIADLVLAMTPQVYQPGEIITKEGHHCIGFLLITSGVAEIEKSDCEQSNTFWRKGDCLGSTCVISHSWSQTVKAVSYCDVWVIRLSLVLHIIQKYNADGIYYTLSKLLLSHPDRSLSEIVSQNNIKIPNIIKQKRRVDLNSKAKLLTIITRTSLALNTPTQTLVDRLNNVKKSEAAPGKRRWVRPLVVCSDIKIPKSLEKGYSLQEQYLQSEGKIGCRSRQVNTTANLINDAVPPSSVEFKNTIGDSIHICGYKRGLKIYVNGFHYHNVGISQLVFFNPIKLEIKYRDETLLLSPSSVSVDLIMKLGSICDGVGMAHDISYRSALLAVPSSKTNYVSGLRSLTEESLFDNDVKSDQKFFFSGFDDSTVDQLIEKKKKKKKLKKNLKNKQQIFRVLVESDIDMILREIEVTCQSVSQLPHLIGISVKGEFYFENFGIETPLTIIVNPTSSNKEDRQAVSLFSLKQLSASSIVGIRFFCRKSSMTERRSKIIKKTKRQKSCSKIISEMSKNSWNYLLADDGRNLKIFS